MTQQSDATQHSDAAAPAGSAPVRSTAAGSSQPVLVWVPGVAGAPQDGSAPFSLADAQQPRLQVTELGATRGDGVFETIGVFDGSPVNLGPHLRRLARSAQLVDLPEPDLDVLAAAVTTAIEAHAPVPELTVRVMMTRGVEGAGTPSAWVHARIAEDWSRPRAGIRVVTLDRGLSTTVAATSPWLLAGAKTLSYAVNMAATREAQRRGADDVLFVSTDGYCLEGPTSTLLVQRGGTWTTTPTDAGVLPGTSVVSVFEVLRSQGATVQEELMTPQQVAEADAAWLLSSSRLAAPIAALDGTPLAVDVERSAQLVAVLKGQYRA